MLQSGIVTSTLVYELNGPWHPIRRDESAFCSGSKDFDILSNESARNLSEHLTVRLADLAEKAQIDACTGGQSCTNGSNFAGNDGQAGLEPVLLNRLMKDAMLPPYARSTFNRETVVSGRDAQFERPFGAGVRHSAKDCST